MSYPTDSGLLTKAVRRIAATVERIHAADGATRTKVRDRRRAAGSRAADAIAAKLRSGAALGRDVLRAGVQRVTGELVELAERSVRETAPLLANARRGATPCPGQGRCPGPGGGHGCCRRATSRRSAPGHRRPGAVAVRGL